jgi:hypothetical protein
MAASERQLCELPVQRSARCRRISPSAVKGPFIAISEFQGLTATLEIFAWAELIDAYGAAANSAQAAK